MDIEGFHDVLFTVRLAKELHDIKRFDVMRHFCDTLCYDYFYENILEVISAIFAKYHNSYDEEDAEDFMIFEDDVISDYFVYAMEYGKRHKLPHDKNPYVNQAYKEVGDYLSISYCVAWKLLGYTKTKKTARQSKLLVYHSVDCGCNALEGITFGLIKIYAWFKEKCDEFKALEPSQAKTKKRKPRKRVASREVIAA